MEKFFQVKIYQKFFSLSFLIIKPRWNSEKIIEWNHCKLEDVFLSDWQNNNYSPHHSWRRAPVDQTIHPAPWQILFYQYQQVRTGCRQGPYAFLQYTVYTYMHSYNIQYIHICIPTIYKYTVYTHTIYSIYNTYLHSIYIYFSSDIGPQNDILEYISIVTMVWMTAEPLWRNSRA